MRTLRIAATLALFRAAIKVRGVRAAMRLAAAMGRVPRWSRRAALGDPADVVAEIRRVAQSVPFRADCLPQSLTGWLVLHRAGFEPSVRLGIALDDTPNAHAWLELAGEPVGEPASDRFHAFPVTPHLPATVVGARQ